MLSFSEYSLVKNELSSLFEATIQASKYGNGTLVVLKSDKVDTFQSKVNFPCPGTAVFKKVDLDVSDSSLQIGNGDPLVTLEVLTEPNGKLIGKVTWRQDPSTFYNHLKIGTDINWGGATNTLETAQCLGVYLLKDFDYSSPAKRKALTERIKKILNNGEDWDSKGKSDLLSKIDSMSDGNFGEMIDLAEGMSDFVKAIVKFDPHIIHGSINDYYAAEEQNEKVKVQGVKANTADMIICSAPAAKLIDAIKTEDVIVKDGLIETKESKIQFYQVSLKKAPEGAQLGKITGDILARYNIPDYMSIYRQAIEETYCPQHAKLIEEGFSDILKKGASLVKGILGKIKAKAVKLFSNVTNFLQKRFKSNAKDVLAKYSREFGLTKDESKLFESYCSGSHNILNEKKESLNDKLKNLDVKSINKLVSEVEETAGQVLVIFDKNDYLIYGRNNLLNKFTESSAFNIDIASKLLANLVSFITVKEMISKSESDMNDLIKDIVEMQKEVYFGKTSLPLFKVYGKVADKKSYEFLGTAKDFIDSKTAKLSKETSEFPLAVMTLTAQKDNYYNSVLYMISEMGENEPIYSQFRMGTNTSGKFSFNFEGVKTSEFSKVLKSVERSKK
jgi:hypothetical protein